MSRRIHVLAILAVAGLGALAALAPAASAAGPAWQLNLTPFPGNFAPGASYDSLAGPKFGLRVYNVGAGASSGPVTITDTLPAGLTPVKAFVGPSEGSTPSCTIAGQEVSCVSSEAIQPGDGFLAFIGVDVSAPAGAVLANTFEVSGGGAATVQDSIHVPIGSTPPPFDFSQDADGLSTFITDEDGAALTQAGSHPYKLTVEVGGFPLKQVALSGGLRVGPAEGGVKDLDSILPPGVVLNPAATPVRCTEAQLESNSCPSSSAVGVINLSFLLLGNVGLEVNTLYNMVPPPGSAAAFAFNAVKVNIYPHILGGVHEGDYRLSGASDDILNRFATAFYGAQLQFWDSSAATPLISMPTACGGPLPIDASADSWEDPATVHHRSAVVTDLKGNPTEVTGCDALHFSPTMTARPTTTAADAPSGLSVDLHIPQASGQELATAHLRKAVVKLPEGISLNPSSANGLEGCSLAQIGVDPSTGVADGSEPTCPGASRIGTVEVDTPLLDHALPGSVYVATPHDNPFDSLLAIYVVVDDPQSGTLIKLAGHVEADPSTGQLTTTFDKDPQLPFTDFKLSFFGGAGGVLRTPSVCGNYSTTSEMTPWSAPQSGPPATPSDSYPISGNCASSEATEPNKPEFEAGAVSPIAGKYSPFVVHLKREDGSQQFSKLTVTPPPGLTAKLAGTPACPDADLAAAAGKSGHEEQVNPSCPANSRIGTVHVGAGAGPAPYYAAGAAYLAGPYKGAPLSMAIVTPAVAGPYDLGTVVTRVALHVDPATTRITADADPVPSILEGVPLDVRSIDVALDKPGFSKTGTSCDPMAVSGLLTSTLGQGAALKSSYQLGNCANLPFKPQLGLRLLGPTKRGQNPKLIATLSAKDGEANISSTQVRLPRSAFLDQSHIRTVCTRVQFAAGAGNGAECPAGSIYGQAEAKSPLLEYTLTGNVYLRSSSHKLPDLVVALHGPPSQPIAIELDGRTDSVKGALRNTFEAVPDAPVSLFRLVLFGGKRGLVQNSRDICAHDYSADVAFGAQNGDLLVSKPKVKAQCGKGDKKRHKRHPQRSRRHSTR